MMSNAEPSAPAASEAAPAPAAQPDAAPASAPERRKLWSTSEVWLLGAFSEKSGKFARKLIENARATGDPNLLAYAYRYLTHYVTDTVGHPYVNRVVQGPWRVYWQRHHLVENFIDAYAWDRWHVSNLLPTPPSTSEQPLDTLSAMPNVTGAGARSPMCG